MSAATIEGLFQKARQAIEQRDWSTAKMMYLQALGLKSDLPDVHYGLATVYFQLRELTSAAHHFKEVTRLDPRRVGAFVNLGAVLNLLDHLDEAVVALRRSIQLDGKRVEGYYNLGLVYRRKGQIDLAIQAYREAIRLNPRMSDALLNLGNLLFEKEQYRQAETHYEKALELRPGWEKALDGLEAAREAATLEDSKASGMVTVGSSGRLVKGGGSALDQTVDPTVHAALLTNLHQSTIDSMDAGRLLQQILEREVEPVIKELSSSLLSGASGGGGASDLEECVKRFETALQHLRDTRDAVGRRIGKLRELQVHFPAEES